MPLEHCQWFLHWKGHLVQTRHVKDLTWETWVWGGQGGLVLGGVVLVLGGVVLGGVVLVLGGVVLGGVMMVVGGMVLVPGGVDLGGEGEGGVLLGGGVLGL